MTLRLALVPSGAAAGLLHGGDLVEDQAVAAGEERAAVDDHVDLVGAGRDRLRRVGELDLERGAAARERRGDGGDRDEAVVGVAVRGAERLDRERHHVAVDADGGDAGRRGVRGVGVHRLRDERAHLAGGVGALERRQVDELDDAVERPLLGARLDRAGAEPGGALLEADGVDAGDAVQVAPQASRRRVRRRARRARAPGR